MQKSSESDDDDNKYKCIQCDKRVKSISSKFKCDQCEIQVKTCTLYFYCDQFDTRVTSKKELCVHKKNIHGRQ